MEEWRQIDNTKYWLSNEGVVYKRNTCRKPHIYTPPPTPVGTPVYNIGKNRYTLPVLMNRYWKYEWIKHLDEDEVAKPIPNTSGFITNKGRVWSGQRYEWATINKDVGFEYYECFSLDNKKFRLHTTLGRVFLPDYKEGLLILHRYETLPMSEVNNLSNLWVGTPLDNMLDKVTKGRHNTPAGERHYRYNPSLHRTR